MHVFFYLCGKAWFNENIYQKSLGMIYSLVTWFCVALHNLEWGSKRWFIMLPFTLNSGLVLLKIMCKWPRQPPFFKNKDFIYLLERESARDSMSGVEGQREREKQIPHWAGSLMQDSIPGPQDHDLRQRQMLKWLSHPGTPSVSILI